MLQPAPSLPLKPPAAASELGVTCATLKAWRHRGRGPAFVRVGRAVRYRPEDLAAFLARHRVGPQS
jgi:predicted site-specific integrase-resolvase